MDSFCADSASAWKFIGEIVYIIRIVIPVIIILLGTIDLGKAVLAGEDKKIKEAQKAFIKRLIYGVAVFFIFTFVKIVFGLLGVETDQGDTKICWDCATKPHNKSCLKYVEDKEKQESIQDNDNKDDLKGKEEI